MPTGTSLPIRATFIASCATLVLTLLCGCAKQGLALMTTPPVEACGMTTAQPAATAEGTADILFEQALAECTVPAATHRSAFAPSL